MQEASGNRALSGGFQEPCSGLGLKSQILLESGKQGDVNISINLPPEGRESPQEILSQQPISPLAKPAGVGESPQNACCSSS